MLTQTKDTRKTFVRPVRRIKVTRLTGKFAHFEGYQDWADDESDRSYWYYKDEEYSGDIVPICHDFHTYEGNKLVAKILLGRVKAKLAKVSSYEGLQSAIRGLAKTWAQRGLGSDLAPLAYELGQHVKLDDNLLYHLEDAAFMASDVPCVAPRADWTMAERYLPNLEVNHKLTIVRSPKNTGKTTWLKSAVAGHKNILLLGHRRTLLRSQAQALGLGYYEDLGNLATATNLAVTLDSLWRLADIRRFKGCTLVLDEVSQVLSHLVGKTLGKENRRNEAITALIYLLMNASHTYALDADVTQNDVNILGQMAATKAYVIVNEYQAGDRTFVCHDGRSKLLAALQKDILAGLKVVIADDTKEGAKDIFDLLTKLGKKVFLVTADNAQTTEVQAFIANPMLIQAYDALVYSPSLGTGFDLNFDYFDKQYLLGSHLAATELHQLAYRVRKLTTNSIHFAIRQPTGDTLVAKDVDEVRSFVFDRAGCRVPANGEVDTVLLAVLKYKEADRIASCRDLVMSFITQALDEGYEVVEAEETKDKVKTKELREARKVREIEAILAAKDVDEVTDNTPKAERDRYYAHRALVKMPCELTEADVKFYLKDREAPKRYLDLFLEDSLLQALDDIANEGKSTLDHQHRLETTRLLREILGCIEVGKHYTQKDLEAILLPTLVKREKDIKRLLGIAISKKYLSRTLSSIVAKTGDKLGSQQRRTVTDVLVTSLDNAQNMCDRERVYFICPDRRSYLEDLKERALAFHREWATVQLKQHRRRFQDMPNYERSQLPQLPSYSALLDEAILADWYAIEVDPNEHGYLIGAKGGSPDGLLI